jgi:hypothetical protein
MKVKSSSSSFKCLPNMFCVKNTTILFIVILGLLAGYFIYSKYYITEKVVTMQMPQQMPSITQITPMFMQGSGNSDILENPYAPPLRNDGYFSGISGLSGISGISGISGLSGLSGISGISEIMMPINVRTQGPPINTNYRQVGLLTRINGKETILPLMGRPLLKNRDKWQFYTMSDKNNSVKLPISFKKKSCTSEYGCDNIYNGDTVYVEGYKDAFQATIYDNAVVEYF